MRIVCPASFRAIHIGVLWPFAMLAIGCVPAAPSAPRTMAPTPQEAQAAQPVSATPQLQTTVAARPEAAQPAAALLKVPIAFAGFTSDGPVYIAIERGYFQAQGIEPELVRFTIMSDAIAPLASGQLFVAMGIGVNAGLFNSVAQGIPLRAVANQTYIPPDYPYVGWVLRKDLAESGRVKEPADLRGLNVGLTSAGTASEAELEILLNRGGLTTEDINIKTLGFGDQVPAFANKSLDLAYTTIPFIDALTSQGLVQMFATSGSLIPNTVGSSIIYSPNFAEHHPEAARGWMVAFLRGVRDFLNAFEKQQPPDDVVQTLAKYGNEKDPAKVRASKIIPVHPDGRNSREAFAGMLDYLVRTGQVRTPPDLEKVLDTSFAEYAVSRLGKYSP